MSSDNAITLIAAVLAFVASLIAIAASVYSTRFGRFISEKWWERKVEAYSRIVEALAYLVDNYQSMYDAELEGRELTDERKREIDRNWKRENLEVRKAALIGTFRISPEAEKVLKQYWEKSNTRANPASWFQDLEDSYTSAETCLKELVICAKKDLRV